MIGRVKWEDHGPDQPGQNARDFLKNNQTKKGWRCYSSDRALSSKCEAMSSIPSVTHKKLKCLSDIFIVTCYFSI
jgi:hypothetical protein